jgi:predicted nucleic acid-binding protein
LANSHQVRFERVVLDSSVLLSGRWRYFLAGADLGFYQGLWSSWIVSEITRKRTEWIAKRATSDQVNQDELERRLTRSRARVSAFVAELSEVLRSVDYATAPLADLSWLKDPDDWPVMQTALAADADILVTDDSTDFPLGERRNGVLILNSTAFLEALYARFPEAEAAIREYLGKR